MTRNNLCIISISGRPVGIGLSTWAVDKKLLDTEQNSCSQSKIICQIDPHEGPKTWWGQSGVLNLPLLFDGDRAN